jgi:hypothetical protein
MLVGRVPLSKCREIEGDLDGPLRGQSPFPQEYADPLCKQGSPAKGPRYDENIADHPFQRNGGSSKLRSLRECNELS